MREAFSLRERLVFLGDDTPFSCEDGKECCYIMSSSINKKSQALKFYA